MHTNPVSPHPPPAGRTGAGGQASPAARAELPANPLDIKAEQAKADAIIEYAAKVKDWPLLEQAVDLKIEQQRDFEWVQEDARRQWLAVVESRAA